MSKINQAYGMVQGTEEKVSEPMVGPVIARELEQLEKAVADVFERAELLINRVNPVLTPEGPVVGEVANQVKSASSPVAESLRAQVKRLQRLSGYLSDANGRVEL